jgi:hypothetical protein
VLEAELDSDTLGGNPQRGDRPLRREVCDLTTILMRLKDIYFHELFFQTSVIINACEQLFAETPSANEEGEPVWNIVPAAHGRIGLILSAAANVKKLLTGDVRAAKDSRPELISLRIARTAMLWEALAGLTITELLDARVRNSLEHFDEWLDAENLRLQTKPATSPVYVFNVSMPARDSMSPEPYPLRLYLSSTRRFLNFSTEIDIGKIYGEAKAIRRRLIEKGMKENAGGALVVLDASKLPSHKTSRKGSGSG